MAKITSAKTVIDNNKLFTSQINDDDTRQFNEYDITLQDIQTKQLDFTVDVTPIDDKLEKLTVSFDGNKFIGMDIRNREVYNFQATTPYNLDVSNQIGTFERPVRKIVLLGPDNGLRVPTINPTLEWRADSSAEGYRVEVSANGFVTNVYSADVSGTTHTVSSNLAFDTTYEWRVAGTNKGGVGEYSDPRSFITRIGDTNAVTLLTPTNGDDVVNVTPTFSWTADANAVSYQIQISTSNFASNVIDTTTFNTNFSTTLVHDQTYQWRVRSINEFSTSVWSTVWTFQVESNVVGNVSLSSPSNGQTGVSIPTTLSWGTATNATSYDVQVSTNNFASFVYNDNTTSTSVSIPGLGFDTNHQWRVRGINRTNVGNFASRSFETRIGDVGSLTLTAPSNGQTISSTSQTFTWNAVTNATIYDIQISTNNFASFIVNTSTSSTSYTYSSFSLGVSYQWRVRARNAYSTGSYVSRSFSVFSPSLSLSRSSASFDDGSGSVTFSVTSNTTWTVSDNQSWISVTGADGSGNDSSVTINVDQNTTTSSRSGTITVETTDGTVSRTISVSQAGVPTLSLSRSSASFGDGSDSVTFSVTSNTTWTVSDNQSWISVTGADGSGNDSSVTISVTSNTSTSSRSGVVTVQTTDGRVTRTISVSQAGVPTLSLSRSSASFGDDSGSVTFSVTSNTTWAITDNRSWITTSGADGSGNDSSVTINVSSNTSTSSRTGTVTVQTTDGSITRTISVSQAGQPVPTATPTPTPVPTATPTPTPVPFLNLSRSSGSIGSSGGVISFSVSSNISWAVSDNRSWISISSASGSGSDGYVAINVSSNSSTSSRSGTVTVSGGGITRTISVSQAGQPAPTATPTPVPTATPTPTPTPTPPSIFNVQYVVVAGGGGGGGSWNLEGGGGGGAGGYISSSANNINVGSLYNVTVGAGGASVGYYTTGIAGNDTTFLTTAIGGGRGSGGAARALQAGSGGSGGGSGGGRTSSVGGSGTPGQGYNGGGSGSGNNPGGGGGGAGSAGQNGTLGGAGGSGVVNPITNTLLSEGGSGGVLYSGNGISGGVNTGSGGDGSGTGFSSQSGSGGSGIVILRYPSSYTISNPSGGLSMSTSTVGGDKVTQITSGTGTVRFT